MTRLKILGQQPLRGFFDVNGSKNSATKILVASLLTTDVCTIDNVPRVEDVARLVEILQSIGANVAWHGQNQLAVEAKNIAVAPLDQKLVRMLRSSVMLMGALLGRFGETTVPTPGGDQIGARSLSAHLHVFRRLGIEVREVGGAFRLRQGPRGDVDMTMSEFSVTATENALLASVLSAGQTTIIRCAAADPSVQDLCWFLETLGAKIEGMGTHTLKVLGVTGLTGTDGYRVMPDPVEAGTMLCLALASHSPLRIRGFSPDFMHLELEKFAEAGGQFSLEGNHPGPAGRYALADIVIEPGTELRAVPQVHNMPYPGFCPDLLPPFAVMMTQASGTTLIHDWMYEGRLKYVEEINKMGAEIFTADPHRILVNGPSRLYAADITNYDIRTGASGLVAALLATGTSHLAPAYQLDRGYEKLDERLNVLGAKIEREAWDPGS